LISLKTAKKFQCHANVTPEGVIFTDSSIKKVKRIDIQGKRLKIHTTEPSAVHIFRWQSLPFWLPLFDDCFAQSANLVININDIQWK
jgi:hypothetical protein